MGDSDTRVWGTPHSHPPPLLSIPGTASPHPCHPTHIPSHPGRNADVLHHHHLLQGCNHTGEGDEAEPAAIEDALDKCLCYEIHLQQVLGWQAWQDLVLQRQQRQKFGSGTTETKFFSWTMTATCLGTGGLSLQDRRWKKWPFWSEHKATPSWPAVPKISVAHRVPERTLQELTQSRKISILLIFHHKCSAIHPW